MKRPLRRGALLIASFAALSAVVLAVAYLFYPRGAATVLAALSPEVTYFVETPSPVIALTVDDGPDAEETPAILDTLRAYGARATFFLIGSRIAGQEALLERMRAEGHELANHGYDDRMSLLVAESELARGVAATHTLVAPFGAVRWFRPASGFFNAATLALAAERQYGIALGDVFPLDSGISSPRFHRWYILRHARPGSIIILHDAGGRGLRTAAAISRVIPVLRARGLTFVTLTELMALR